MQVFTGVDFKTDIDSVILENIQDRMPSTREFVERILDQASRALRPRIEIRPRQRARETGMRGKAQTAAGDRGQLDLVNRPSLSRGGIAAHFGRGKGIELGIVGGVNRDQLALQVRRQFGDRQPFFGQHS